MLFFQKILLRLGNLEMGVNVENFTLDIFFCPSILTTPDVDQEVTEYSTPTDKYEFENKSS